MRQKVVELGDRIIGDALEHIAEPGERINAEKLAGSDKAAEHGCGLTSVIATEEGPVVAADGNAAQSPLGGVVVDGQIAVVAIARQRRPVLERVSQRLASLAFGQ